MGHDWLKKAMRVSALVVFFLFFLGGCTGTQDSERWAYQSRTSNQGTDISVQIDFLEDRLKTRPKSFLMMAELAGAYLQRGKSRRDESDLARAKDWVEKSLAEYPNGAAYLVRADLLQMSHSFDEALEAIGRVRELDPANESAPIVETKIFLAKGDSDKAAQAMAKVPDSPLPGIIFLRGQVLESRGDIDGARKHYHAAIGSERVSGSASESARMRGVLARLELNAGNLDEAESLLEAAHSIPTDQPLTEVLRAKVMAKKGQQKKAAELLRAAYEHYRDATFLVRLGEIQLEAGEAKNAKSTFETAAKLMRQDSLGHERDLALALYYSDADANAQEVEDLMKAELARRADDETLRINKIVSKAP